MITATEIKDTIQQYNELDAKYVTDFDLTEEQEDEILKEMNKLLNKASSMIVSFTSHVIDEKTAKLMITTQSGKLIDILNRAGVKD